MCTSPILIKNRSRRYVDGVSKMFFRVPCGHCKECLKSQQDEWFVRAFFEYLRCKNCGGHVFFPTFSYNKEHLPIYSDDVMDYHIPCFSYKHILSLRNKLRVYLTREGYDAKGLRFIITSEFGGRRGRPHYHALFFCPFDIRIDKFLQLLQKSWIYGFVMVSKKHGLEVRSVNGIQYCMKYCSKEQYWTKKYGVDKYIYGLKDRIANGDDEAEYILKDFRKCLPKHYQSVGFGMQLVDILSKDYDSLIDGRIDLSKFGFITKNKFKFTIPRYIKRKILFDKDEYNTDIPSFINFDIFEQSFKKMIDDSLIRFSYLQSFSAFQNHFEPLRLSPYVLRNEWHKICYVRNHIKDMIIYNLVYRDVPINKADKAFGDIKFYTDFDNALFFSFNQKFNFDEPREMYHSYLDCFPELFTRDRYCFNDLPFFHPIDEAIKRIENLEEMMSRLAYSAWLKDEEDNADLYHSESQTYAIYESSI